MTHYQRMHNYSKLPIYSRKYYYLLYVNDEEADENAADTINNQQWNI